MDNLFFCLKIKNFIFKINFFKKNQKVLSDFFVFRILLGKDQIKKQNLEDTKMKDYSKMLNEEITWKSDAEILEYESKYKGGLPSPRVLTALIAKSWENIQTFRFCLL